MGGAAVRAKRTTGKPPLPLLCSGQQTGPKLALVLVHTHAHTQHKDPGTSILMCNDNGLCIELLRACHLKYSFIYFIPFDLHNGYYSYFTEAQTG